MQSDAFSASQVMMLPSGWETCLLARTWSFAERDLGKFWKQGRKKGGKLSKLTAATHKKCFIFAKAVSKLASNFRFLFSKSTDFSNSTILGTHSTSDHDWPLRGLVGRYESYALFTFGLIVLEYLSQRLRRGLLPWWDFSAMTSHVVW